MDKEYLCCSRILGLELEPNSIIDLGSQRFILTNSIDYIFKDLIKEPLIFQSRFGDIHMQDFNNNRCYIFNKVIIDRTDSLHFNNLFVSSILQSLWNVKDNSIFVSDFFYIPTDPTKNYVIHRLNYNLLNSSGQLDTVFFSNTEISSALQRLVVSKKFIVKKNQITPQKLGPILLHTSQDMIAYNDKNRVERSLLFLLIARTQDSLPIKIANYICFLECLFSTTGSEITHQCSERIALFLYSHDSTIDKLATYKLIKSAYTLRSKFVHGSKLEGTHKKPEELLRISKDLDDICRKIYNYILDKKLFIFDDDNKLHTYFQELVLGL